jgi:hypothetical protein
MSHSVSCQRPCGGWTTTTLETGSTDAGSTGSGLGCPLRVATGPTALAGAHAGGGTATSAAGVTAVDLGAAVRAAVGAGPASGATATARVSATGPEVSTGVAGSSTRVAAINRVASSWAGPPKGSRGVGRPRSWAWASASTQTSTCAQASQATQARTSSSVPSVNGAARARCSPAGVGTVVGKGQPTVRASAVGRPASRASRASRAASPGSHRPGRDGRSTATPAAARFWG